MINQDKIEEAMCDAALMPPWKAKAALQALLQELSAGSPYHRLQAYNQLLAMKEEDT